MRPKDIYRLRDVIKTKKSHTSTNIQIIQICPLHTELPPLFIHHLTITLFLNNQIIIAGGT